MDPDLETNPKPLVDIHNGLGSVPDLPDLFHLFRAESEINYRDRQ
jgi:hypothetical protein